MPHDAKKKRAAAPKTAHRIYVSLAGHERIGYICPDTPAPGARDGKLLKLNGGGLTLDPDKALVLWSMAEVTREIARLGLVASGEREEKGDGSVRVFCRSEIGPIGESLTVRPNDTHAIAVLRFHVETAERALLAEAEVVARHLRECADAIDIAIKNKDVAWMSHTSSFLFGPNDVPILRERATVVDAKRRVLSLLEGKKDVHL